MNSGSASKYDVLSKAQIAKLPICDITDKNCVLFLWATTPLLTDGIEILYRWGFNYKTAIYWRKFMSLGMGFWFRGQVEVCLMGIKGKIKAFRMQKPNFIQTKALRHSEKPEEMRKLIEETGLQPRIELFARRKVEGWDCWGNEVESDIDLEILNKEGF